MNCVPKDRQCPHPEGVRGRNDSLHFSRNDSLRNDSLRSSRNDNNGPRPSREDNSENRRRSREDDDNPFLDRRPRDDEDDFERNETSKVLNDTRLRRMLGRSFNPSIIDEIIGRGRRANMSSENKDRKNWDACDRRYSHCIKAALANLMLFKDLDGECCRMTQEPLQFARRLRNITRKFIDCPSGTRFSPFSFVFKEDSGCIPMNRSDDGVPDDDQGSSWRNKSRKGSSFCEILKRSIRGEKLFSSRHLVRWLMEKNNVSLFTKHCPKGKKFCPSSFDCRSKEQECRTEKLTQWASKNLCNSSERLCLGCRIGCRSKDDGCRNEANMSKPLRQAALSLMPGESSYNKDLFKIQIFNQL